MTKAISGWSSMNGHPVPRLRRPLKLSRHPGTKRAPFPTRSDQSRVSPRLIIGRRTGFAYYKDDSGNARSCRRLRGKHRRQRLLRWPVRSAPDNFLNGNELKDAIVAAGLADADTIDRFGILPSGDERVLIKPYFLYLSRRSADVRRLRRQPGDPRDDYYERSVVTATAKTAPAAARTRPRATRSVAIMPARHHRPKRRQPGQVDRQADRQIRHRVRPARVVATAIAAAGRTGSPYQPAIHRGDAQPSSVDIDNIDAVFSWY